jgi:hypothetical protein
MLDAPMPIRTAAHVEAVRQGQDRVLHNRWSR